jgi:signal transduction histidine kinase
VRALVNRLKAVDPRTADRVLAVSFAIISVVALTLADPDHVNRTPDIWAYLLVIMGMGSLAWRRQYPFAVLVVTSVCVVGLTAPGYPEAGLPFSVFIAFYTAAAYGRRRNLPLAGSVLAAAMVILWVTREHSGFTAGDVVGNTVAFSIVWVLGETIRSRRERLAAAEERAQLLEQEQAETERRVLAEERLRIAQELHDVVAHAMSVITVQAGVGAHVIDTQPQEAKKALVAIEATGRSALQELRRMLGLLRQEGDARGARQPAPGFQDMKELIASVRATGVQIDERWVGDADIPIPASIYLSGYRILQEALTNVLKHAGRANVVVTMSLEPGWASIEVVDDGRGAAALAANGERSHGGGYGLVGMRERVAVFGGTLEAGPRGGGGFRVLARFPLDVVAPSVEHSS